MTFARRSNSASVPMAAGCGITNITWQTTKLLLYEIFYSKYHASIGYADMGLGVDAAPILKVLGLPMLIGAVMLWVRWSNIAKRLIEGDRYE